MSRLGDLVAGRYRLLRRLGHGGMSVVWQARDERLGRTVAVKELHHQPGLNPTEAELADRGVYREARITAQLEHPHAVSVFDVVDHEGRPCLILQFVPSEPLSALIRGLAVLSPRETARIGFQVASALAAAHELGIVHRDVKPGNVLIADDGTARISDFGISHAMGDNSVTPPGMVHGTPAYLAPEIARGGEYGYASDVYGLGATLYAAAEGVPPFGSDRDVVALLQKVGTGRFVPPTRSAWLTPLLLQMLAEDPGERPTMAEVARRLGELVDHDVETVPRPVPAVPAESTGSAASTGSVALADAPPAGPPARPAPVPGLRARRTLAATGVLSALVLLGVLTAALLPGFDRGRGQAAGAPDTNAPTNLYASVNFAIPFTLAAPTWVAPEPAVDERDLVTWRTADTAIRVLVPVEVYPPGDSTPSPPPQDYLTYLLSQSVAGARFTDRSLTTVGGQPATLVTATASRRLAGALGCPEVGMAQQDCFGLRPERQLRIAVVELGGRTLLIWLRSDRRSSFEEERLQFEQTLSTVQFR